MEVITDSSPDATTQFNAKWARQFFFQGCKNDIVLHLQRTRVGVGTNPEIKSCSFVEVATTTSPGSNFPTNAPAVPTHIPKRSSGFRSIKYCD
ncbi:MAG: hypothetical protein CM1200mP35_10460 [Chloroflexota bacterium]|nr:MAG: hypothetical protein CM1200mP35_10460 [Chloroflexota bacterium]